MTVVESKHSEIDLEGCGIRAGKGGSFDDKSVAKVLEVERTSGQSHSGHRHIRDYGDAMLFDVFVFFGEVRCCAFPVLAQAERLSALPAHQADFEKNQT
jgi:hypothetical protein